MNDINQDTMEHDIINVLNKSKRTSIIYIILVVLFLFPYVLLCLFANDGGWRWTALIILIGLFLWFIVFIIWKIIYQTFAIKIYKILLKYKITDLPVKDISIWWWFVPFMNMYKPYQVLKDVYNYAKLKVWRNDNILIYVRRISFLSLCSMLILALLNLIILPFTEPNLDFEDMIGFIFQFCFYIIGYCPIFFVFSSYIIFKLRKLYKVYLENQQKE